VGAPSRNFLTDGDVVTTTIEGIGTMTNRCVRVSDWRR
jgi:2-keto-4-pentenoate hydratase/2-oxohepta-3-ene-1,7-dioic acid hydratase in catechol pathway